MTTSTSSSFEPSPPPYGLLALSPELILEIVSYIRADTEPQKSYCPSTGKQTEGYWRTRLASLRFVCRYLRDILEYDIFKSISIDFSKGRLSESDLESQLSPLLNRENVISRCVKQLTIKSLRTSRRAPGDMVDVEVDVKLQPAIRALDRYFDKALLSFQNLRAVDFHIEHVDDHSIRAVNALSTLPSLDDVTLNLGIFVGSPAKLAINQFAGLRKLQVILNNPPRYYGSSNESPDELVYQISDVIKHSPLLFHLGVIQPARHKYDVSFHNLVKAVAIDSPLMHLRSLHIALPDIQLDATSLIHLKALKKLHVEGSAHMLYTGDELWPLLAKEGIHLTDITVHHLSEPLTRYLLSYSGLQRLHVLLAYYPGEHTTYDRELFLQHIIPRHKLSPMISAPSNYDLQPLKGQGLIYAQEKPPHTRGTLTNLETTVSVDSVVDALPFILDYVTQPDICLIEKLHIRLSYTKLHFGCGSSMDSYVTDQLRGGSMWLGELQIAQPQRFPNKIKLGLGPILHLLPKDDSPAVFTYDEET